VIPYGYFLSLGLFWPTVYVDLLHINSLVVFDYTDTDGQRFKRDA